MKNVLLYLFLLITLPACKEEGSLSSSVEMDESNTLIGKWQLVKSAYSIGTAEQYWQDVENGYILNLKKDGSFESNKYKTSDGGTYEIEGDHLILDYSGKSAPTQYTERFAVNGDSLSLSPVSPIICIEGCTSKLVRIK